MRNISTALVLLYLLFNSTTQVFAQSGDWIDLEPQGEPAYSGWTVGAISDTRQVLLAGYRATEGSEGRLFISRNAGATWSESFPLDLETTSDVSWHQAAMSGTGQIILLAGSMFNGSQTVKVLNLSTDTGQTWTEITSLSQESSNRPTSVAVSESGQIMLVGNILSDDKLYLSTNAGVDWSAVEPSGNPSDTDWRGVSISGDGQTMLASQGAFPSGGNTQLYRSQDGGLNWTPVAPSSSLPYGAASTAISQDGQVMLAGQCSAESPNEVYISTDGGESWLDADVTTMFGQCFQVSLSDDGQFSLIVSNNSGDPFALLYSEDYGASWSETEIGSFPTASFGGVATSGDGYNYLVFGLDNYFRQFISDAIPTPSPEPPPTSPTPAASSETGGPRASRPKPPRCEDGRPPSTPNLFQIDVNNTQATVYFAPVPNADRYYISYGDGTTTGQYGVEFVTGNSSGVIGYTINQLAPGQQYSFLVRGGNGCMPGDWGNTMTVRTRRTPSGGQSYYKDFVSRVLSVFPQQIIYIEGQRQVLGAKTPALQAGCQPQQSFVKPDDPIFEHALTNFGALSVFQAFEQVIDLASLLFNPQFLPPQQSFLTEQACTSHT